MHGYDNFAIVPDTISDTDKGWILVQPYPESIRQTKKKIFFFLILLEYAWDTFKIQ